MDRLAPEWEGMLPRMSWSRRGFVMTSLASGFALSVQPVSAQTVITTDTNGLTAGEVKVPAKDGEIPAYQALPNKGGPFPTVLVVHEIWGVHEHIKDLCRRLAKAGYYAIAPELYARQGNAAAIPDTQQIIREIVAKVPDAQVMSDLDVTAAFAKASGKADSAKLAVTGFCWGGRIVWLYAAHNPGLKAAAAWYGVDRQSGELTPKNPADIAGDLKCPVLALYGGSDQSIPPELIEKRQAACKAAGKTCESKVYPDTPHGFNADYRPSYRAEQAKDGWERMLAWFKQNGVA
jgi:carboxymethylenebutenolidase